MEREKVGVLRLTKLGVEDSVDSEDGGTAVGVNGVACEEGGLIEVVLADEG